MLCGADPVFGSNMDVFFLILGHLIAHPYTSFFFFLCASWGVQSFMENGHFISIIESSPTSPSGEAAKNGRSKSTNSPAGSTWHA